MGDCVEYVLTFHFDGEACNEATSSQHRRKAYDLIAMPYQVTLKNDRQVPVSTTEVRLGSQTKTVGVIDQGIAPHQLEEHAAFMCSEQDVQM